MLPYSRYAKIREQAYLRGLLPALAVTNSEKKDLVVLSKSDLDEISGFNLIEVGAVKGRKTIVVNPEMLDTTASGGGWMPYVDLGRGLRMVGLDDFRRLTKGRK